MADKKYIKAGDNELSVSDSKIEWTNKNIMLQYESETGKPSLRYITDGFHVITAEVWHYEFID